MPRMQPHRRRSISYIFGTVVPCILIISSLAAFTILSVEYLYIPSQLQQDAPQFINTSTIMARQVSCALPRSGQYCNCQRYIYYGLLIATIGITLVFRHDDGDHCLWLASGAAATAMLYSGVAAVHQIFIFGYGLQIQRHSTCEFFSIPGTDLTVPVCFGFDDMDRDAACMIVGAALLAILPMAVWSAVFKKAAAKPLLILWMLLMASSHVFCAVSKTETTVHYQICPTGQVEELPGITYVTGDLTDAWRTTFSNMATNTSTISYGVRNCLYSCFAPKGYPLIAGRAIAVLDNTLPALNQIPARRARRLGVAFWAIYLAFSLIALLEFYDCQYFSHGSRFWPPFRFVLRPLRRRFPTPQRDIRATAAWRRFQEFLHLVIHFPRGLSAVMLVGYITFLEYTHRGAPESESFAAVGQFGAIVVVLLVVVGAIFSKFTERKGIPNEEDEEGKGSSSDEAVLVGLAPKQ